MNAAVDLRQRMEARRAREGAGYCQRPECGLPETAGTHRACSACCLFDGRCDDDDCHDFEAQLQVVQSSAKDMRVVNAIKQTIVRRQGAAYGSLQITDAQIEELSRGIAAVLLTTFNIEEE